MARAFFPVRKGATRPGCDTFPMGKVQGAQKSNFGQKRLAEHVPWDKNIAYPIG